MSIKAFVYSELKKAMAEAGHIVSEGEEFVAKDFAALHDFAHFRFGLTKEQVLYGLAYPAHLLSELFPGHPDAKEMPAAEDVPAAEVVGSEADTKAADDAKAAQEAADAKAAQDAADAKAADAKAAQEAADAKAAQEAAAAQAATQEDKPADEAQPKQ